MYRVKKLIRNMLPQGIRERVFSVYHWLWAFVGAVIYRFPSREIMVIAVTGTKGKSSTVEFLNAIFEEAGWKTALTGTIRFKIGDTSWENMQRMSMPGRFFLQSFLRKAVNAGCAVAIVEMTSEGARQHRHRCIDLNALVFTNLAPEHIESHGSFEKYVAAKLSLAEALAQSPKRPRIIVANADDVHGEKFLAYECEHALPYSLNAVEPYTAGDRTSSFTFHGTTMRIHFPGAFSIYNALAAATVAEVCNVSTPVIARGLAKLTGIPGRAQRVDEGQPYPVVIDNAHTPDSLKALYEAFKDSEKICVLGSMGGSRDKWKRPEMGKIASEYCARIILTNEDPCDDDPESITRDIAQGIAASTPSETIIDRRAAIRKALQYARANSAVLITGKGTDISMKVANGKSIPWSDVGIAQEELRAHLNRAAQ